MGIFHNTHKKTFVNNNAPEFCTGCHVPKEATTNWYLEFPKERSLTMMPTGTVTRNCQTWNLATQQININKKQVPIETAVGLYNISLQNQKKILKKQRKMWHSFGQIQRIDLSITSKWTRVEAQGVSWPNFGDSFWLQVNLYKVSCHFKFKGYPELLNSPTKHTAKWSKWKIQHDVAILYGVFLNMDMFRQFWSVCEEVCSQK